jgi:hypothetical protein
VSVDVVVHCDARWPLPGRGRCSGFVTVPATDGRSAWRASRAQAATRGWSVYVDAALQGWDLCPAHTRLAGRADA